MWFSVCGRAMGSNGQLSKEIMYSCERCWSDANRISFWGEEDHSVVYQNLLKTQQCTPEENAGPDSTLCVKCKRKTIHQHVKQCVICGENERVGMDVIVDLELQVTTGKPARKDWIRVIAELEKDCAKATKEGYHTFSILVLGIK